mgnify:CR=1 FL=1
MKLKISVLKAENFIKSIIKNSPASSKTREKILADKKPNISPFITENLKLFDSKTQSLLVKKAKIAWLENYAMPFSMLISMAFAVIAAPLFGL